MDSKLKSFLNQSRILFLVTGLVLVSCSTWTPTMTKDEIPTGNDTYLYGKFNISAPKIGMSVEGYYTIGFVFSCTDGRTYTIRLSMEQPVQLIKLSPSTCSFTETVFVDAGGNIRGRKPVPEGPLTNFKLEPGVAYYIGDFLAFAENQLSSHYSVGDAGRTMITDLNLMSWGMKEPLNNYQNTTGKMKSFYPNMAKVPVHNRLTGQ